MGVPDYVPEQYRQFYSDSNSKNVSSSSSNSNSNSNSTVASSNGYSSTNSNTTVTYGTFAGLELDELSKIDADLFSLQAKIDELIVRLSNAKGTLVSICSNEDVWGSLKGTYVMSLYYSIAGEAASSPYAVDCDYVKEINRIEKILNDFYDEINNKRAEVWACG